MNIFEKATRSQLRFPSSVGPLNVEQVWALPLNSTRGASLKELAIAFDKKLKESSEISFLAEDNKPADQVVQLQFDIVKHIYETKKAENKAQADAALSKAREQKLLELLEKKRDAKVEAMSEDEILKELAKLKAPDQASA